MAKDCVHLNSFFFWKYHFATRARGIIQTVLENTPKLEKLLPKHRYEICRCMKNPISYKNGFLAPIDHPTLIISGNGTFKMALFKTERSKMIHHLHKVIVEERGPNEHVFHFLIRRINALKFK